MTDSIMKKTAQTFSGIIVLIATLLLNIQSAVADTSTVFSQDYESYATGDIKSTLESNGWTFQYKQASTQPTATIVSNYNGNSSKALVLEYNDGNANRNQNWLFGDAVTTSLTGSDNWTLEFAVAFTDAPKTEYIFSVVGASSSSYEGSNNANKEVTNPWIKLKGTVADGTGTTYKLTIGSTAYDDDITLTGGKWYKFKVEVTDITASTATVNFTISDYSTDEQVYTKSISNLSTTSIGVLKGINWNAPRNNSFLRLDDVKVTKEVDESVCDAPSMTVVGANGTSRTYELNCPTDGATIYYSFTEKTNSEAGWNTYNSASKPSGSGAYIWAFAQKGSAKSDVVKFATGAGSTINLLQPVFTRTTYNSGTHTFTVRVASNQSDLQFKPATVTYSINIRSTDSNSGDIVNNYNGTFSSTDGYYNVSVPEGGRVTAIFSASGYGSTTVTETAGFCSVGTRPTGLTIDWAQDFTGKGTTAPQPVVLNAESFTVGGTTYYTIAGYNDSGTQALDISANVGLSNASSMSFRNSGNLTGILNNGGVRNVGIRNLTAGQYFYVDLFTQDTGTLLAAVSGCELLDKITITNPSQGSQVITQYWFKATATTASFSIPKGTYNYLRNITVYKNPAIAFVTGGKGTCATTNLPVTYGEIVELQDVTPADNYVFYGWYTEDGEGNGTLAGDAGDAYTVSSDVTLYAHYAEQVATTSTVGSLDRHIGEGQSSSPFTTINAGEKYIMTFHNYGLTAASGALAGSDDNTWYVIAQDNNDLSTFNKIISLCGNGDTDDGETTGNATITYASNATTYNNEASEGATVTIEASFDGEQVIYDVTVSGASGNSTFTQVKQDVSADVKAAGKVYVRLTTKNAYLTDLSITKYTLVTSVTVAGPEPGDEVELGVLRDVQLTATVLPDDATDKSLTWTSSNESVATVDETGKVTGVSAGTTTITATSVDGVAGTITVKVVSSTFAYTVNAVDGSGNILKQLASGEYTTGNAAVKIYVPRFVFKNNPQNEVDTLLQTAGTDNGWNYSKTFTPDKDNYVYEVKYTANTINDVVFYDEAENMTDVFTQRASNTERQSGGNGGYNTEYKKFTTLKPGIYTIYAALRAGNTSDNDIKFRLGTEGTVYTISLPAGAGGGSYDGTVSDIFITENTDIYVKTEIKENSSLDLIYIQKQPIYAVTTNEQKLALTEDVIGNAGYADINKNDLTASTSVARDGVTGTFYSVKGTGNYVSIVEQGALAMKVSGFHGNNSDTRHLTVYVDGVETATFDVAPGTINYSNVIAIDAAKGKHTIKISGNGANGNVTPATIVFYTESQEAQLIHQTAEAKVGVNTTYYVTVPDGCTVTSCSDPADATLLDVDKSTLASGYITLTGKKLGTTTMTFNITGDGVTYTDNDAARITVTVKKSTITLAYWNTDVEPDTLCTDITIGKGEARTLPALDLRAVNEAGVSVPLSELTLTPSTDDPSIATVDESGNITLGAGTGSVSISVKASNETSYETTPETEAVLNIRIIDGYDWKITEKPGIRSTFEVTNGEDGENKVVYVLGTFGGWNRNDSKYTYPNENGSISNRTDSWGDLGGVSGKAVDGFSTQSTGANDACDETRYSSEEKYYMSKLYGSTRYGWFKQPDYDGSGNITKTYPYTLPVRGTYITLEPKVNGTMSVYIQQNGPWNKGKKDVYDNDGNLLSQIDGTATSITDEVPFQYRPHAFYFVDQNGVPVTEYTDLHIVSRTTVNAGIPDATTLAKDEKQKKMWDAMIKQFYGAKSSAEIATHYGEAFKCIRDENDPHYGDLTNVAMWKEFKEYMSEREQQEVEANWSNGVGGAQTPILLDNGATLALHNGMVKYSLYVTAGQTYYLFSNFSKLGMAGVNFVPDDSATPTETLALSENDTYSLDAYTAAGDLHDATQMKEITGGKIKDESLYMFETISLDRTFNAGQWNTICLPYTVTEQEVREIFGDGTELLLLDKVTITGTTATVYMVYHEIQDILAGYPYLIKPTQNVTGASGDNPFVVKNKVIDATQGLVTFHDNGYTGTGIEGFCTPDSEKKGASVLLKKGDIFLSANKLYLSKGSSYMKGYRSYFSIDGDAAVPSSVTLAFTENPWDDEETGEPTYIDMSEIAPDAFGSLLDVKGVYSLSGQKVADNAENLPAGVYIVNGKKMFVK